MREERMRGGCDAMKARERESISAAGETRSLRLRNPVSSSDPVSSSQPSLFTNVSSSPMPQFLPKNASLIVFIGRIYRTSK